ncbi:MAG: hypothetical protein NTX11_02355 [Candidatus Saccharibacteria bacterium]|nr:hypothetical protein [Candidatus Saccharibacteria bacterium]
MNKLVLYGLISICSGIGSWIPSLWHAGFLSAWGIIGGIVGCFVGVWLNFQLKNYIDL